jgi:hypothetical protein
LELVNLSILAVKPNPETARALEAQVREQILKPPNDATYVRRNAAIEQERVVKENELNSEIAVETNKRQIGETQLEAERSVLTKRQVIQDQEFTGRIAARIDWALLASGHITLCKVDGWKTMHIAPAEQILDLAA